MISVQKYLEPVAPDKPSGENLSYAPDFLDLQNKVRGKEETQFSAAEDPNWKELLELASELTLKFKHLQAGVILSLALAQTEGLPGFRDGLNVLLGWLEKHWETVYPQLDSEDNNDPTERVNLLQCLSVTTSGDPYRFCDRLSKIPLCESKTLGRYDLAALKNSRAPADPAQVAAVFRDTSAELLQSRFDAVCESIAALTSIDDLLGKLIGAGRVPNFESLRKILGDMRNQMSPYVTGSQGAAKADGVAIVAVANAKAVRNESSGLKRAIDSREDVLTALSAVCDYYRRCEPSSPVPFLLERARRLVSKDFLQIMSDLAPDTLPQWRAITGTVEAPAEKT
jgi:type VI secretion system protein ImpA